MIEDQQAFEAALEQVNRYLERPPREGSADDAELERLLEAIAAYRPTFTSPRAESALERISQRADRLVREAERLHGLIQAHMVAHLLSFPSDGEGVGPTTGAPRRMPHVASDTHGRRDGAA